MEINDRTVDKMFQEAMNVSKNAYSPYSRFNVAAALLCDDGTEDGIIFTGVNVENASYGLTICAERSAVFTAVSAGFRNIEAILILTERVAGFPCGACRQVLAEFNTKMSVYIALPNGVVEKRNLAELLPDTFEGEFLKHST